MSGTHVFYNGVLMRDCVLTEYDQTLEMDQSHTDVVFSRTKITVESMLVAICPDTDITLQVGPNGLHNSIVWLPTDPGSSLINLAAEMDWFLPDRVKRVQQMLEEPRKDFWMAVNGATFKNRPSNDNQAAPSDTDIDQDPYRIVLAATGMTEQQVQDYRTGSTNLGKITAFFAGKTTEIDREKVLDCANGPMPKPVRIIKLDGGRAARIVFSIEVCRVYTQVDESAASLPPVRDAGRVVGIISNRWGIRETIDEEWKTNYNIEGVIRIADRRYQADAYRIMTTCHMIPYAQLTSREFYQTPDGLTLNYRYSMKEEGEAAPPLTVKWGGEFRESVQIGAITQSSMNVKVIGSVNPPGQMTNQQYKLYMFDVLMKIIGHRINITGNLANAIPGQHPKTQVIKDFTIMESIGKPEVGVSVLVSNSGEPMFNGLRLRVNTLLGKEMSLPGGYDPKWWPIPPAYTWDVESMSEKWELGSAYDQYFQSPASEWHGKPRGLAINHAQIGTRNNTIPTLSYMYELPTPTGDSLSNLAYGFNNDTDFYWAGSQFGGFSYIQVEAENLSTRKQGQMVLPLSKPRPVSAYGSAGVPGETISVVPIHAGVQKRQYKAVCSRIGTWPQVPLAQQTISQGGVVETLLDQEISLEPPKPDSDGKTLTYTIHCLFTYAINKAADFLRAPNDPRINLPTGSDLVAISQLVDGNRFT